MDRVTRATPLSGTIGRPKAKIWHSLQFIRAQNLTILASAVPETFQRLWNSRMRFVALTTPTYGTVGHLEVITFRGQTVHKIWSLYSFSRSEDIYGVYRPTILALVKWPWPRPFQGRLVVRGLTLDIAYNHTKFDDSSFSNHRDGRVKS